MYKSWQWLLIGSLRLLQITSLAEEWEKGKFNGGKLEEPFILQAY